MNFNIDENDTNTKEWELFEDTTEEIINLYGVEVLFIISERVDEDILLGNYRNVKLTNSFEKFYLLPNDKESWDMEGMMFSRFGSQSSEGMNYFIARRTLKNLIQKNFIKDVYDFDLKGGIHNLIGNVLMLPDGKLMEITHIQETKGQNNLMGFHSRNKNEANVYEIVTKQYINNFDEIDLANSDLTHDDKTVYGNEFANLDEVFNRNQTTKTLQDSSSPRNTDKEDNIFGTLG